MLQGLRHALNPGLRIGADGVLMLLEGGTWVCVGAGTEGVRLHWLLECGVHCVWRTPHAVAAAGELVCRFCLCDQLLRQRGLWPPTLCERRLFWGLQRYGLDGGLRPQVVVDWWPGRVDFGHHPSGVLIQVDGPGHFCGSTYGLPAAAYRRRDVSMCASAWRAARILVRVHHLDLESGTGERVARDVIAAAAAGLPGPLLVLTPHYSAPRAPHPRCSRKQLLYVRELSAALQLAQVLDDISGTQIFHPTAQV